jgi:hypothetical protein
VLASAGIRFFGLTNPAPRLHDTVICTVGLSASSLLPSLPDSTFEISACIR